MIRTRPGSRARWDQRVYTSRLLGRDPSLVLHGGGNTSVKLLETILFGESEEVLYVKGRGADLARSTRPDFRRAACGGC